MKRIQMSRFCLSKRRQPSEFRPVSMNLRQKARHKYNELFRIESSGPLCSETMSGICISTLRLLRRCHLAQYVKAAPIEKKAQCVAKKERDREQVSRGILRRCTPVTSTDSIARSRTGATEQ
jgi:hypothetical protein